jgi:hypothetical protein
VQLSIRRERGQDRFFAEHCSQAAAFVEETIEKPSVPAYSMRLELEFEWDPDKERNMQHANPEDLTPGA